MFFLPRSAAAAALDFVPQDLVLCWLAFGSISPFFVCLFLKKSFWPSNFSFNTREEARHTALWEHKCLAKGLASAKAWGRCVFQMFKKKVKPVCKDEHDEKWMQTPWGVRWSVCYGWHLKHRDFLVHTTTFAFYSCCNGALWMEIESLLRIFSWLSSGLIL